MLEVLSEGNEVRPKKEVSDHAMLERALEGSCGFSFWTLGPMALAECEARWQNVSTALSFVT